jgi:hypothetical protein
VLCAFLICHSGFALSLRLHPFARLDMIKRTIQTSSHNFFVFFMFTIHSRLFTRIDRNCIASCTAYARSLDASTYHWRVIFQLLAI